MRRGIALPKGLLRNAGVLLRPLTNTLINRPLTSGSPPISDPSPINIEIDRSLIKRIINRCIPKSASGANSEAPSTHSEAPSLQDITTAQNALVVELGKDKDFKKDFYKLFQPSRGKPFGINYEVPKELDYPFIRMSLAMTILKSMFELNPALNQNKPLYGDVVGGVGEVKGHKDTILKDGKSVLVKHLAIINLGGSTSDCKTWFKRNEDIVYQLKRDFPSSYYILKTINFTSKDNDKIQPIIGKDDELNFIDHSLCLPIRQDLIKYGISNQKILVAKLNLDKVINSKEGRQNFLLKDEGDGVSQVVCLPNEEGSHGRESGVEGERRAIAAALQKSKMSVTGSSVLERG